MIEALLIKAHQKGSDKVYREWISRQPSCLSGRYSEWHDGVGYSIACHVRRSKDSGTGYKAPYSCIPATRAEHDDQHRHSEAGCLERHLGGNWTREEAAMWFDRKRVEYLERWVEEG